MCIGELVLLLSIFGKKPEKAGKHKKLVPENERPVKFVKEKENVWRVVYADE